MSVNSLLYNSPYRNSLLGILNSGGNSRSQAVKSLLNQEGAWSSLAAGNGLDTVSLALAGVSDRFLEDLAQETAAYLKDHPSLQDDYVLAVINGQNGQREIKVFRRSEVVASQAGTAAGQKLLDGQLKKNPILCYSSASQLPMKMNPDDAETAELSARLSKFLEKNKKLLNLLDREGFSPFNTLAG